MKTKRHKAADLRRKLAARAFQGVRQATDRFMLGEFNNLFVGHLMGGELQEHAG